MTQSIQVAFVFPGQGSQQVGMLLSLADSYPIVRETFVRASDVLDLDLWSMIQQGPQELLNLTENAQPALLAASYALWRVINKSVDVRPAYMTGHSLGEWSALVCAGALTFEDGLKLVRLRGQYMQEAVPVGQGTMAAIIGLDDGLINDCCQQAADKGTVAAVNYNAPGQVVIAGHVAAVERAIELCKSAGAKRAVPLSVTAPFHTALMKPAAERLAVDLSKIDFQTPQIPVIQNVHARAERDPHTIKSLLIQQIYSPVKWVDCIYALHSNGIAVAVECGPGKVLGGLVKRIERRIECFPSDSPASLEELFGKLNLN